MRATILMGDLKSGMCIEITLGPEKGERVQMLIDEESGDSYWVSNRREEKFRQIFVANDSELPWIPEKGSK